MLVKYTMSVEIEMGEMERGDEVEYFSKLIGKAFKKVPGMKNFSVDKFETIGNIDPFTYDFSLEDSELFKHYFVDSVCVDKRGADFYILFDLPPKDNVDRHCEISVDKFKELVELRKDNIPSSILKIFTDTIPDMEGAVLSIKKRGI